MRKLKLMVGDDVERFREAGAALDVYYSPEAVCRRSYARYKDEAIRFSGTVEEAVTHPAIGPYRDPDLSLAARFGYAWEETYFVTKNDSVHYFVLEQLPEDIRFRTALDLLTPHDLSVVATRRVLLAWLRLQDQRIEGLPRITEFQDLITVLTDDGDPPLVITTEEEARIEGKAIYKARDGLLRPQESEWFQLGRDALDVLSKLPHESFVSRYARKLTATLSELVVLEEMGPFSNDANHNRSLLQKRDFCIKELLDCHAMSSRLKEYIDQSVWSTAGPKIVEMRASITTLKSRMAGARASGFSHPVLRVSNAPEAVKAEWKEHEGHLWHMVKWLKDCDISTPSWTPLDDHTLEPAHTDSTPHSNDIDPEREVKKAVSLQSEDPIDTDPTAVGDWIGPYSKADIARAMLETDSADGEHISSYFTIGKTIIKKSHKQWLFRVDHLEDLFQERINAMIAKESNGPG